MTAMAPVQTDPNAAFECSSQPPPSRCCDNRLNPPPGQTAEWWLVPVATGRMSDLHCGVKDKDGKTHAEHGMVGEIVIR